MDGSRGTANKLKEECEVIMVLSYIVKYALLRIVVCVVLLDPRQFRFMISLSKENS